MQQIIPTFVIRETCATLLVNQFNPRPLAYITQTLTLIASSITG
jgi:hypothetical protein